MNVLKFSEVDGSLGLAIAGERGRNGVLPGIGWWIQNAKVSRVGPVAHANRSSETGVCYQPGKNLDRLN